MVSAGKRLNSIHLDIFSYKAYLIDMPITQQPKLEYVVISVQFDPATGTDYLLTRQELISSSLAEAEQSQAELIPQLQGSYRCYIQERYVHTVQYGKRATSVIERCEVLGVRNLVEKR